MTDNEYHGSYKDYNLTAYERRKRNSQKIASVQFEPKSHPAPKSKVKEYYWKEKPQEPESIKKTVKPVWTPLDQAKEEALWDEE